MELIILIVHLFLALAMIGVILLQRSEGGALGMGGGGGGGGALFTARGAANLLTRTTAILATLFIATSLTLAIIASNKKSGAPSIVNPTNPRSAPVRPGDPPKAPAAPTPPAAPK